MVTQPLRVAFNGKPLTEPGLRGLGRYTVNIVSRLAAYGIEPIILSHKPVHPDHRAALGPHVKYHSHSGPTRFRVWEQYHLPKTLRAERIPILHATYNEGLPIVRSCVGILTVHDAIDERYYGIRGSQLAKFSPAYLQYYFFYRSAIRAADHVITVSNHARDDIHRYLRVRLDRLTMIYEAADDAFTPATTPPAQPEAFLYIGGWESRKNLAGLLQAFTLCRHPSKLIIVGGTDTERAELLQWGTLKQLGNRLILQSKLTDVELQSLYQNCLAFVYPSHYEGFGLQVCEAMASHVPIVVANRSSLPEIAGFGGQSYRADSPVALARVMDRIATVPEYRAALLSRSAARSTEFSWDRAAELTSKVYHQYR